MREKTHTEIVAGIVARLGIVTAHGFEFLGGFHTITVVMVLWSVEELLDAHHSARNLHQRLKRK